MREEDVAACVRPLVYTALQRSDKHVCCWLDIAELSLFICRDSMIYGCSSPPQVL